MEFSGKLNRIKLHSVNLVAENRRMKEELHQHQQYRLEVHTKLTRVKSMIERSTRHQPSLEVIEEIERLHVEMGPSAVVGTPMAEAKDALLASE